VNKVRGKPRIWVITAVFIATLAVSMMGVPKAFADNIISVTPPESGPKNPGDSFSVDIELDYAEGVRAFEFTLSWNPRILRLNTATPIVEGPFLSMGGPTYFVKSIGIAGESITAADLITVYSWADGSGVLATINFEVIAGGQTDLALVAKMLDADFNEMYVETVGGHFWSPFPFIDFTWFVDMAVDTDPTDTAEVTGYGYYATYGDDGDMYLLPLPPTTRVKPVLALDGATGAPENIVTVEAPTMYYGDEITFDASKSYDFDNMGNPAPLSASAFRWVIRAAGQDTILRSGKTYDSRYESGAELPYGPAFSYTFPGALPSMYTLYGPTHLGWHDLTLEVTDSDGNVASYHTWIRIFRISPARTVNLNIPDPKHSISKDGNTITFGAKMQNRGGASDFPYDALVSYIDLGRMIHGSFWGMIRFDVLDPAGNVVGTAYTDAIWFGPTEIPIDHMHATWTIPSGLPYGTYTVSAKGYFCSNGVTFGFAARGTAFGTIKILP
jgi:hypothetical protein